MTSLECVALIIGVGAYQRLPPIKCAGSEAKIVFGRLLSGGIASRPILRHDQDAGTATEDGYEVPKADRCSLEEAICLFQARVSRPLHSLHLVHIVVSVIPNLRPSRKHLLMDLLKSMVVYVCKRAKCLTIDIHAATSRPKC
ncbi:hypothetical protein VOLCADRAFT_96816 [Volvox carteri f. nagariensis]|uniref:Uncharacterized protein n=1 Tax=Volvox carteri f. nagariensis TaxID=3068 RepID=D8UB50_VOLCA|nr:uncharacterized protein VOLCADRAFT_96816 [Volvox carteri f. nagariensis]EFJ43046.1 hypothetical protein VOLCADRAFT_96816 [Volvox carteri f. nagariensis]|eukprot:XP_002955845.1 hypothetical protein VOLCADRAFT_96816 [Volvox carteri f. nagariensis]